MGKAAAEKAGPKTSNQDEDLEDEMEWAVAAAKNAIKKVSAWGKDKKAAGAKKFAELKEKFAELKAAAEKAAAAKKAAGAKKFAEEKAVKAAAEKAGQDEDLEDELNMVSKAAVAAH